MSYEFRPRKKIGQGTVVSPEYGTFSTSDEEQVQPTGHKKRNTQTKKQRDTEKSSQVTYRSNLHAVITLLGRTQFREEHILLFKKTPFWTLIEALMNRELASDFCKKNDDVIMKIISSYKKEQEDV